MTRTLNCFIALTVSLVVAGATQPLFAEWVADFENLSPITAYIGPGAGHYENGKNLSEGFASGGATFSNDYNAAWESWQGWSHSNTIDTLTAGFGNQYSAYTLRGAHSQAKFGTNYGVAFPSAAIDLPGAPIGAHITNTTYAALSMLDGDSFAKKFGGASGDEADWFLLTISGKNAAEDVTGTVDFYLADYQSDNNADDYLIHDWTWVDLSSLGADTRRLEFSLTSSDNGSWGMNTPGFFAMDNLTTVPEPGTAALFGIALVLGIGGYSVRQRRKYVFHAG